MIGETISHYRITQRIGAGGMGVVYEAVDLRLDRTVALKFLPPGMVGDPAAKARFIHEAKTVSALDHPNILTLHEIDETPDGGLFLVTARYEGETLKERLAGGPLPVAAAVGIARQVAEGLAKAHDGGVIHRDIKPANIFITTDGIVKILDFGLAKLSDRTVLTRDGVAVGTAKYMAPEQARGEPVDQRTDLWCLGAVLYEMVTGSAPFPGDFDQAVIYALLNTEPAPLADLRPDAPPWLGACVARCLAKDPDRRPRDARALLAEFADEERGRTRVRAPRVPAGSLLRIVAALVLVVGAVIVVGRIRSGRQAPADAWLIVADMENLTDDAGLAPALREALVIGLQQSRHVRVVTGQRLGAALGRMGRTPSDTLTEAMACELAQREGVPTVLATSLDDEGGAYQLVGRLLDPATREPGRTIALRAADQRELMPRLDQMVREIRRGLGESGMDSGPDGEHLEQVTTFSLDALRFYTMALEEDDKERAIVLLKQAVAVDSTFAMAHARLARELMYSAQTQEALAQSQVAFDLRGRLPLRERLFIEGEYYRFRTQYDKAIESMRALLELDPEDETCRNNLVHAYLFLLQYRKALDQFSQLAPELRERYYGRHTHGLLLAGLGDFAGAEAEFRQAIGLAGGMALPTRMCMAAALISDLRGAEGLAQLDSIVVLDADAAIGADYMVGRTLPLAGRFDDAMTHLAAARSLALAANDSNRVAWADIYASMCLSVLRDHEGAARVLRRALEFWSGELPRFLLGAELAAAGDTVGARAVEEKLRAMTAADPTNRNVRYLTKLRGTVAFSRGDLERAAEILEACPLDLDARLLLGRTYAALGDVPRARAHLRFVVANQYHAFIESLVTTAPLAYYFLGVLEQEAGNREAAVANLRHFVALWSDADADVAELTDARLRLEQLEAGG